MAFDLSFVGNLVLDPVLMSKLSFRFIVQVTQELAVTDRTP